MDGTHVLAVDDDRNIQQMLQLVLEDAGYEVVQAFDGQEALEYLRTTSVPHVVLLDLNMPRLDGIALLNVVAQDSLLSTRNAFVLVTAHSQRLISASTLEFLTRLAIPIVCKPFRIDDLLHEVERALTRLDQVVGGDQAGGRDESLRL
jgi:CheY-like chemotaxis protein